MIRAADDTVGTAKLVMARSQLTGFIALFLVVQGKFLTVNKRIFTMAFMKPEKALDRVPWKVNWWALRKLGVEVCLFGLMLYAPVNNFSVMLGDNFLSSWVESVLSSG